MASITAKLPPELLSRIFSLLARERQDIRACRLVSTAFRDLSSPFLITSVVFATRFATLDRLLEILEHSYFHKYVTDLIYDASVYERDLAVNYQGYRHLCSKLDLEFDRLSCGDE